jgi:hypothetical protein
MCPGGIRSQTQPLLQFGSQCFNRFLHFSKPLAPIAFACVQNYFLRHCAFMTVTNLFKISIFLPFSLRWRKVGK